MLNLSLLFFTLSNNLMHQYWAIIFVCAYNALTGVSKPIYLPRSETLEPNSLPIDFNILSIVKAKLKTCLQDGHACVTLVIQNCWYDDGCECSDNNTGKNDHKIFSGFERDSNPRLLRCRCNALPTKLSKLHESGREWIGPLCWVNLILGSSL